MPLDAEAKTYRRKLIGDAVRRLRQRLNVSQEKLADLVGDETSACTVSRWELSRLKPYPRSRARLAQVAMEHGWLDLVADLDTPVPFEEWLDLFKINFPDEHANLMTTSLVTMNAHLLYPEGCEDLSPEQIEITRKYHTMMKAARELLDCLIHMGNADTEVICRPPNERFSEFWHAAVERRERG